VARVLALIALAAALACGDDPVPARPDAKRGNAAATARLDPAPFRAEIEAVEALLYTRTAPQPDEGERLRFAVESLFARIGEREAQLATGEPVRALREFGARQLTPAASPVDRSALQSEWEAVRDRAFARASWFETSSVEQVEALASQPRRLDRTSVSRLTQLLDRLDGLADAGERECDALASPVPATPGEAARPVASSGDELARWQEYQRGWVERVDAAARDLPSAEPTAPRDFTAAVERVGAALRELRDAPAGVGRSPTPVPGQWQPRFAAARKEIARAREHLARLP
jgi:hypothetical protein